MRVRTPACEGGKEGKVLVWGFDCGRDEGERLEGECWY